MSNEAEPSPSTTPACRTVVGTLPARKISPTSTRDARCSDSSPGGCRPLRYTSRCTPSSLRHRRRSSRGRGRVRRSHPGRPWSAAGSRRPRRRPTRCARPWPARVALDHLDVGHPRLAVEARTVAGEHPHRPAGLEQPGYERSADVPGGSGHQRCSVGSGHGGHLPTDRTGGRRNSMPSDHVRWMMIGPRTPPVTRRWRPVSTPSSAAARTSSGMPAPTVVSA